MVVVWAQSPQAPTNVRIVTASSSGCTTTISPGSNLATAINGMSGGQTLCLNSGTYSSGLSLSGISKTPRVMITSVTGQGATITGLSVNNGTSGLTFDHLTFSGTTTVGASGAQPHDITFQYSSFNSAYVALESLVNANVLLDHTTHNDTSNSSGNPCCRLIVEGSSTQNSGVVVQYATVRGGNTDGVRFDQGATLQYSEITQVIEQGTPNHTDSFQCYLCGSGGVVLRGNYIHGSTDSIGIYDGSTNTLIEDNVIDETGLRPWGIESYAGVNAIVRHNTVLYGPSCDFGMVCGLIDLNTKGASSGGIQVYDNIATSIGVASGQTISRRDHNLLRTGASASDISGSPIFQGGSLPTTFLGFKLTAGSAGHLAASDGLDVGARFLNTCVGASC
jgi:hypothetical protein